LVAVVFWLFLAAAALTPMIVAYKTRKLTAETIRAAIERGQDLSPELIKQLSGIAAMSQEQKVSSVQLRIAGAIVMFSGVGAAAVATVFLFVIPMASPFVYAGAALVFCIGAGLHIGAKMLREHEQEQKVSNTAA
jgi:hypothetical protein